MMNLAPKPAAPAFTYASAERFAYAIAVARQHLGAEGAANLTDYLPSDYTEMRCFLSEDSRSGFVVKDSGELVNVFSLVKGRGDALVRAAIAEGATSLDCYDGHLPRLYGRNGFVETGRVAWDDAYAPEGWTFGRPDVVFMALAAPAALAA